ncbi:MAG: DUF58 domain-containing protein [Gemmataceae bacterium]
MSGPSKTPKKRGLGQKVVRLLTHNYCPEFDKSIVWLRHPVTVLITAAIVAALVGYTLHPNGFVLFAGIITILVLGLAWPLVSVMGLSGVVSFETLRVHEGEDVTVSLQIRNRLPVGCWGIRLHGLVSDSEDTDTQEIIVTTASGWRTTSVRENFIPPYRGILPQGDLWLVTGFPFGLWQARKRVGVSRKLIVHPRTYPVGSLPELSTDASEEGSVSRNKAGTSGDVLSLRPYRRGDNPRRIHWSQTARHNRVIVCELQARSRPSIQIILDVEPRVHFGDGPDGAREWGIRVAASLARHCIEEGILVGLVVEDKVVPIDGGRQHLQRVLDALAEIPNDTPLALGKILKKPGLTSLRNGLQIVVTTFQRIEELPSLRMRQFNLRVIAMDQRCFGQEAADTKELPLTSAPWVRLGGRVEIPKQLSRLGQEARNA